MKKEPEVSSLPTRPGYQANTLIKLPNEKLLQVSTVDLKLMEYETDEDRKLAHSMILDYPFETTVYELIPKDTPFRSFEELFGEYLHVTDDLRRDLDVGDLYLSRSRTDEGASIEHDNVVSGIVSGKLVLMTQAERAAVYGIGDVIG